MSDESERGVVPLARRGFVGGSVGLVLVGCAGKAEKWQAKPVTPDDKGIVEVDIKDHPELVTAGGMVALKPAKAKPVLVMRLENDEFRVLSLRCPHLGCTVRWDNEQQILRCPCHGSSFDDSGAVTKGPAKTSLTPCRSQLVGNTLRFEIEDA